MIDIKAIIISWLRLLIVAGICLSATLSAEGGAQAPVIVAYVFPRDSPILPGDIAARKLTRINYAFANINDGRMVNGYSHDDQNLAALVALKQQNPSLTVLVSVGGWLWSGGFSDMALTKERRAVFISSVTDFVSLHHLDGLDIDWEFPGMAGATNHFRAADKQNYTLLVKELRSRFDKLQRQLHRRLYVTVAAGASADFLSHTEMKRVARYVDTVNLMAYDYYEPDSDAMTGHHAPLYTNPADPKMISDDNSVREYEAAGVPAAKIVLGVPFYMHLWGQVPAINHGLFQPGKELPHGYAGSNDGPEGLIKDGFVRYWDPVAEAPYLYSERMQIFVSYDDAESLGLKCRFVLAHGLRGIMFWSYESDKTGALLDAVNQGLNKPAGKPGETR